MDARNSRHQYRSHHIFYLLAIHSLLSSNLPQTTVGQLLQVVQEGRDRGIDDGRDVPLVYVVFVHQPEHMVLSSPADREAWHKSFLPSPTLESGEPRLVYSYTEAISGFAAWLTPREVEAMETVEGFVDAQPDKPFELETTHTPRFLGLVNGTGLWQKTAWGAGRVVGVMDGGISHLHISFSGAGMPPFPGNWAGTCDPKCTFPQVCKCTEKLLGYRVFIASGKPPLSHGTPVASVAAGGFVDGAGYRRYAEGTASGVAPGAYLSFYAANGYAGNLKASERATAEGVDVLSISLSDTEVYHSNGLAIAGLRAVEDGILVCIAAGNYGPGRGSLRNDAPWLLTVGSSTHDRALQVSLTILGGGGKKIPFYGVAQARPGDFYTGRRRLLYPGGGGGGAGNVDVRTCHNNLGGTVVTGAIVLCWRSPTVSPFVQANTVERAGGAAMVLMNDQATGNTWHLEPFLPVFTVAMRHMDSHNIVGHVGSSTTVQAYFWPTNSKWPVHPFPVVASDSGRGPGTNNRGGILKPDILGPGVNILMAKGYTTNEFDVRSGTSFATPHLSGVAALLKSSHPNWSPAAIRSAIMTTADTTDSLGGPITNHTGGSAGFYATGAGLVNPERADDPGLVYDIPDTDDYLRFICSLGYTQQQLNKFARPGRRNTVNCATLGSIQAEQLNYPSITVEMTSHRKMVSRTLTNVGANMFEDYSGVVDMADPDLDVSVSPDRLHFTQMDTQISFTLTVRYMKPAPLPKDEVSEGYLRWTSTTNPSHVVTSPLSVVFP